VDAAAVQPNMRRTILLLAVLALTTAAAWRRGDAYVLHVGKTDVTMTSSEVSIDNVVALHHRLGNGPYLWVRVGAREYLIRDEAFLREAETLWAPVEALKPEQHELDAEERQLDKRIDAIEDGKVKRASGELEQLRDRMRVVERRQRELDQRSEAMEKVIEAKLRDMVDAAIRDGRAQTLR
jgi:hypothetical protein